MGDVWYPAATRVDGFQANYANGRNRMEVVKCHYTVGVNSYPIGANGYFHFLLNRDGTLDQFAPVDAVCWDSGEWNDAGPGVEVEYHPSYDSEIFNDAMRGSARLLARWLNSEHGFPLQHWSGDRISEFSGWRGFIDHADLIQTAQHYDYWPVEDVAYILGNGGTMSQDLKQIDAWMSEQAKRITGSNIDGSPVTNRQIMLDVYAVRELLVGLDKKVSALTAPVVDVKALAAEIARNLPPEASDVDARAVAEAVRDAFRADPLR